MNTMLLYPLFAMAALTFGIGIWMAKLRFKACLEGLSPAYFLYNKGGKPPEYLTRVTQHYDNLFELPVLFYTVCIIAFVTKQGDAVSITLAWLFVVARLAHAYIHTTYNRLQHRRQSFLAGAGILALLWLKTLYGLLLQA